VKKTILFIVLSISLLNVSIVYAEVEKLHQIILDTGATSSENRIVVEQYKKAFLNMVFKKMRKSRSQKVVLISGYSSRVLWYGTARDFKNRKGGLMNVVNKMDSYYNGVDKSDVLTSDILGVFDAVVKNVKRYKPTEQNNIYIFSPFIDTHTLGKDSTKPLMQDLIDINKKELLSKLKEKYKSNDQGKTELTATVDNYLLLYWVNQDMVETAETVISALGNIDFKIVDQIEAITELEKYIKDD
jgi:hypothetical protein